MRTIIFLCAVVVVATFAMSASRGDGEPDEPDTTEPITGDPVIPLPGSETPMKDPFAPYDIGDPAGAWRLEDLTPDERVVAARGLQDDQFHVQAKFAGAARDLAARARAETAASHLGVENLAGIGGAP